VFKDATFECNASHEPSNQMHMSTSSVSAGVPRLRAAAVNKWT